MCGKKFTTQFSLFGMIQLCQFLTNLLKMLSKDKILFKDKSFRGASNNFHKSISIVTHFDIDLQVNQGSDDVMYVVLYTFTTYNKP